MTEQQIDRAFYRDVAERYAGYGNPSIPAADLLALLDQLDQAEAMIRRQERYIEGLESTDAVGLTTRIEKAEARIKAVEDVLDSRTAAGQDTVRADLIRRALEG